MKVLVIASYEDHKTGFHTAVVEIPEGKTDDEVFIAWYNKRHNTAHSPSDLKANDYFMHGYTSSAVEELFPGERNG